MKKKGFTLIELLVVIAIIAMLMAILMPALSKVKKIASRVVCGTNLKGLGTAQTVYANDYDDEYTVQGAGGAHTWQSVADWITTGWENPNKDWSTAGQITVSASLYLLVREADVSPKSFVCPSSEQQEYQGKNPNNLDIVDIWDFGSQNWEGGAENSVSYSYHNPYVAGGTGNSTGSKSRFAADGTRSAAFAIMADQNPFYDTPKLTYGGTLDQETYVDKVASLGAGNATETNLDDLQKWELNINNAQPHDRESQNVLFADGHTANEKRADVGVKNDNIWTAWTAVDNLQLSRRKGNFIPADPVKNVVPMSSTDTVLVNDGAIVNGS